MGGVQRAGGGCLCPENTLLAAGRSGPACGTGETIVLDTQAGVEHFGRAIARGFESAIVVTEPTYNATSVARRPPGFARELGIRGSTS